MLPLVGFYLQPAVGGRVLPFRFWRQFAEIERVVAIKIAPFNRYQTLDVIRAVAESGRDDIALYTGNDDNIVLGPAHPVSLSGRGQLVERRIVGGLLGQWAVWTRRAVELLAECHALVGQRQAIPPSCCAWPSKSPTPTPRCSTRPTVSPGASPASTRCCVARDC